MELFVTPQPNPQILTWARSEGGWSVDRVANRLNVAPERIYDWENGRRLPTVQQISNLAQFYKRPLSLFYEQNPPRVSPLAGEYRRLPSVTPGLESAELRLAIRQMSERRETAIDLIEELGYEPESFILKASLGEDPALAGHRLREELRITMRQQTSWKDGWQAWREWRSAIESLNVLVFMFPSVPFEEVRGLALIHQLYPVAAVNTKESIPESRIFTMLHEVLHLMLANGNEEKSALADKHTDDQWLVIERFAESAVSHAIVPETDIQDYLNNQGNNIPTSIEDIRRMARWFKMSPKAVATRLMRSRYLTIPQFSAWSDDWSEYISQLPPRKSGPVRPEVKSLGKGGKLFAQLVLEAMDTNRITMTDASRYLGLRTEYFEDLRVRTSSNSGSETFDE